MKSMNMKDLKKKFGIFFKKTWPFWAILLVVCTFFWKVFLLKQIPLPADFAVGVYYPWLDYKWGYPVGVPVKNPITTDVVSFTYPMQTLAVDFLKKGEWPFWNPYILTGTPLLANFQSAPFSPTNFVYFLFDKLTAWSLQIILQHLLVIVFTYLLLRSWKVSKVGSVIGGVVFAFSGYNLIWSQWNGHALSAAFIPLLLYFQDKWLVSGKWKYGVGVTLSLSLQFFSGYPQVVLYTLIASSLLWLFRLSRSKEFFIKTLFLSVFLLLGVGIAAPQILPGAELLSVSQRKVEQYPFEWAFLPIVKVITFLAPDFFGNHATKNYWGPQDYTSNTGFVGVIAVILAGLSVFLVKKKKEIIYSLLLVVVSLLLTFATPVSIFIWKSGIFGLQAATAHRALVLFSLGIAFLSAFGTDNFLTVKKLSLKPLLIPAFILGIFSIGALLLFFLSSKYPDYYSPIVRGIPKYKVALRNLILPLGTFFAATVIFWITRERKLFSRKVALGLLFMLLTFELFRFGWKFTPFSPRHIVFPKTPVLDFLVSQEKPFRMNGGVVVPMNMLMPYELETVGGYDAVYSLNIAKFIAVVNSEKPDADPQGRYGTVSNPNSKLLDLVNTKYLLVKKENEKGDPDKEGNLPKDINQEKYRPVFEDKTTVVLENTQVLPRAFVVYDWEVVEDRDSILEKLLDQDFPLGEKVLLEEGAPIPPRQGKSEVLFTKYGQQESIIKVVSDRNGFLFVSDLFYPGWRAYIDGKESKIYRANYAFRAIFVPEGEHEIKFAYRPDSFFSGLKVSGLSALSLLMFGFVLGRRKLGSYT